MIGKQQNCKRTCSPATLLIESLLGRFAHLMYSTHLLISLPFEIMNESLGEIFNW